MNLITFRNPNNIFINDASKHGIRSFSTNGIAWLWKIHERWRRRAHINLLEILAQVVSILLNIVLGEIKDLNCILAMGDNRVSHGLAT